MPTAIASGAAPGLVAQPTAPPRARRRPYGRRRRVPQIVSARIEQTEMMLGAAPINADIPRKRVRHGPLPSAWPGRPVIRITPVLALEAQLPTGCRSRSTPPGRRSTRGARSAGLVRHSRRGGRARTMTTHHCRPACGSCRSRGRTERAHRSLENAQNAFPTATPDLLLILCSEWYRDSPLRRS